jgi:hypothetical protein
MKKKTEKKPVKKIVKKQVKKAVKKIVKKETKSTSRGVMAVIPYSEIAKPEMYKGKLSLIPTPFNETQIKAIVAPTPANIVKSRPGKGGGEWDYVPGWWFKKKANFVFGFAHDFEIDGERVDGDFITVKGKVTVRDQKTGRIIAIKSDYGGKDIKYRKGAAHTPANYLDIANDFKAAATDCFKRCMVQFGFAMDIYGKSESLSEGVSVPDNGQDGEIVVSEPKQAKNQAVEPQRDLYEGADKVILEIKRKLAQMGAKNEAQALDILFKRTGLKWTSFKLKTAVQAKTALAYLLNSKK